MGVKWEEAAAAKATDLRLRPRRLFAMNPARLGWLGRNGNPTGEPREALDTGPKPKYL